MQTMMHSGMNAVKKACICIKFIGDSEGKTLRPAGES